MNASVRHSAHRLSTVSRSLLAALAGILLILPPARGATDIDISASYNAPWNAVHPPGGGGGARMNGAEIAAAPIGGNTQSGITFGKYAGMYVEVGPDIGIASMKLNLPAVTLPEKPAVSALFNTLYGQSGQVNANVVFTNSAGQTATYSLVGDQTIRDYNNNTFTNDLQGYNLDFALGNVFTQNWWNNYADADGNGHQRLDVSTFILPTSWTGTAVVSMTISSPTPLSASDTDDVVLSALQVGDIPASVPGPPTVTLTNPISSVTAQSGQFGEFLLTLSAAQTHDVIVNFTVKGSAQNGTDYKFIKLTKKIKAGKTSKPVKVLPFGAGAGAGAKRTVVLILQPGDSYYVGTTGKVKVKIIGQ